MSENAKEEIKESFDLFDMKGSGNLSIEEAKELVNSFGFLISDIELKALAQGGKVPFAPISKFLEQKLKNPNQENLIEDFNNIKSKKTGKISEKNFRKYLMSFGLKYNEDKVNEIMKEFKTDNEGNVDYEAFLKSMGF